jgi:hypothetical protein
MLCVNKLHANRYTKVYHMAKKIQQGEVCLKESLHEF